MNLSRVAGAVCLGLLGTMPLSANILSGRVCDYLQSTKSQRVGVVGVRVSIFQGEKRIGEPEVTGTDGSYSFDKLPLGVPLKIEFDRVGYLRHPTIRDIRIDKHPYKMADVFLLKREDATSTNDVAARFLDRLKWKNATYKAEMEILDGFELEVDQRKAVLAYVETGRYQERIAQVLSNESDKVGKSKKPQDLASKKPRIAVLAFKNNADNRWWYQGGAEAAQDVFVTELIKSGKFRVVEREQLNALMQEKNLSLSGDLDPKTAMKLGKILGISYLLTGSVTEYGNTGVSGSGGGVLTGKRIFVAAINARLIDTSTGEVVWADEVRGEEASVMVSVGGFGGGVDDDRMFDKVMKPVIQQLTANLKAADL